jgi:hypothetical protein
VGARCQATGGGSTYSTGTAPANWIPFGPLDCPSGQVVIGAVGRRGAVIDSMSLVCGVRP